MYSLICEECGKEFKSQHPSRKTCSYKCLKMRKKNYNKKYVKKKI